MTLSVCLCICSSICLCVLFCRPLSLSVISVLSLFPSRLSISFSLYLSLSLSRSLSISPCFTPFVSVRPFFPLSLSQTFISLLPTSFLELEVEKASINLLEMTGPLYLHKHCYFNFPLRLFCFQYELAETIGLDDFNIGDEAGDLQILGWLLTGSA